MTTTPFRRIALSAAILAALTAPAMAAVEADLVVPASAHAEGAAGSFWSTDVQIHNAGHVDVTGRVTFVAAESVGDTSSPSAEITIPAGSTLQMPDVVASLFGLESGSGALALAFDDAMLPKLAVSTRTYDTDGERTFGQTIPALDRNAALGPATFAVLFAPGDPAALRFNVGLYAAESSVVHWRLLGADGTVEAEKTAVTYAASENVRYNDAVASLFGATAEPGQLIQIQVLSGAVFPWASRIDNRSQDGDFSTASPVRANEAPLVTGLDTDLDGHADYYDADADGVLDATLTMGTSFLGPYEMNLVATDPEGESLSWSGPNLPSFASIDAASGKLTVWPSAAMLQISSLEVQVSDGVDTTTFQIPVRSY